MSVKGVVKWKPTVICFGNADNLEVYEDHTMNIAFHSFIYSFIHSLFF